MTGQGLNLQRRPSGKSLASETSAYGFLQEPRHIDDGRGGVATVYDDTTVTPIPLGIVQMSARQQFELKTINVDATHVIKIRYADVKEKWRIRIRNTSRSFEVLTVEDIQDRGIVKWVTCRERR